MKPVDAFQAWSLEGEKAVQIKPQLLKRLMDYKARDIITRKEQQYRKGIDKWQEKG